VRRVAMRTRGNQSRHPRDHLVLLLAWPSLAKRAQRMRCGRRGEDDAEEDKDDAGERTRRWVRRVVIRRR